MKTIFILFSLSLLCACAGNTKKDAALGGGSDNSSASLHSVSAKDASPEAVSIEAKLAAAQQNTTNVTEVKFEKGARTLPEVYLKKIEAAMLEAGKKTPLKHLTIVVWSDAEMPAHDQPELGEEARKLATDRGEMIKAWVQQKHPKLSTDIVNMAKKPGKLKKFLRTEDVRIQQILEISGNGRDDPKASRAVVIFETRQAK